MNSPPDCSPPSHINQNQFQSINIYTASQTDQFKYMNIYYQISSIVQITKTVQRDAFMNNSLQEDQQHTVDFITSQHIKMMTNKQNLKPNNKLKHLESCHR